MTVRHIWIFGAIWVVLTAIAEWALSSYIASDPFYSVEGVQAHIALDAFDFLLRLVVPVGTFVTVFILYSILRFRADRSSQQDSPHQFRYNPAFTWSWVGVSIALNLLFVIHPGITGLQQLWASAAHAQASSEVDVEVSASQWEWQFSYPQYGLEDVVNQDGQDELVLPEGKTVKFTLESEDVVHGFWIPALGQKKDVIPGMTRTIYFTPTVADDTSHNPMMRVQCTVICGAGHPYMEADVRVLPQAQFDAWVQQQKKLSASGS
ncbi:MAG: cytochrome c oxidase subunit II [Firmicutes bacterium]|nr:cytochrome c oxidase subunit II [Bacillota bacterium]